MRPTFCKHCGAPIVWIKTEKGKSMPCNKTMVPFWENPDAKGKVVLMNGKIISCSFDGPRDQVTNFGYISHFASCSGARDFRNAK